MIRSSLALAFALVGVLPVFGGDQATIITGSDEFEFLYRVKLPSIDGEARLWMPLARTDAFQTVRVDEISIPIKWEKVHDRDYGNDICVLNPRAEDSGKIIELRYRVLRKEKSAYPASEANVARYLRPEKLVTSSAPKRCTITCSVGCATTNPAPAGDTVTRCLPATRGPVIAPTSMLTSLPWRALSGSRRVLQSAQQSPRTKAKAQSKATIVGRNSSPTGAGFRSISAKHGSIQSWPTIISVII